MSALLPRWYAAAPLLLFGFSWNGCAGRSHEEVNALRRENEQLRQSIEVYRLGLGNDDVDALRHENAWLKHHLDVYPERFGWLSSGLRGSVSATKGERIGVTVGSRDHVKVGDRFWVCRPNHLVGRARVIAVTENCCVAEVVNNAARVEPAVGDAVIPAPE